MTLALGLEFLLLAALWGASFLFMRQGAAEFGALPTAGLRVGLAALFLLPAFFVPGVWASFRQRARVILFAGLLNSGIPFALFAYAVMHIPTGLTAILNATVPLTGAVVAWVWLGDRPAASRAVGLLIGFAGVSLLVIGKSGLSSLGGGGQSASVLAMGACLLATATGSQIGATLGLALPTLWLWPAQPASASAWGAVAAVALLCTSIAYILFFRIIAKAGPAKALTVTFLVPVFALGYGVWLLDETITAWMLVCGLVIVCGTALSTGLLQLPWPTRRN